MLGFDAISEHAISEMDITTLTTMRGACLEIRAACLWDLRIKQAGLFDLDIEHTELWDVRIRARLED